jgi:hypothetical protein
MTGAMMKRRAAGDGVTWRIAGLLLLEMPAPAPVGPLDSVAFTTC